MNPVDFFLRVRLDPRGRAHHVFILNPQHGSWVLGLGPPGATGSWVLEPARGLGLGSWVLGPPEAGFLGSDTSKKRKIAVFSFHFPPKITRRTFSSLPFWYASELDSDVGLGESHRFFGYNTKLSVTYGAQSARRNF